MTNVSSRFFVLVGILLLLPACFSEKTKTAEARTVFVQAIPDSTALKTIIDSVTPLINGIIKDELGLANDYSFDFFLPKKRQGLTLYYVQGMSGSGEADLFSALGTIQESFVALHGQNISLAPEVHFFGGQFDAKDELVIMIKDSSGALSLLNQKIKDAMHDANKQYNNINHADLYDIAKSEQYPYVPHMGLGRIRSGSIKEHIKDPASVDTVFERIQQRIVKVVSDSAKEFLTRDNQQLSFNKIEVFDLQKRSSIKDYAL